MFYPYSPEEFLVFLAIWSNRQTTIDDISPELLPLIMVLGRSPPQPSLMRHISDIGWHLKILFLNGSACSHLSKRFQLKVLVMMEGVIMALVSVWIGAGGLRVKPHLTDELGDPKMLWVLKRVHFIPPAPLSDLGWLKREGSCHVFVIDNKEKSNKEWVSIQISMVTDCTTVNITLSTF